MVDLELRRFKIRGLLNRLIGDEGFVGEEDDFVGEDIDLDVEAVDLILLDCGGVLIESSSPLKSSDPGITAHKIYINQNFDNDNLHFCIIK